jgi:hypothetical protein
MNKEDVKKGYLAAMATMNVGDQDAEEYWNSYASSQHWAVKNHGVSHHVSESDERWTCQDCGEKVDPVNVTFGELHEGCGGRCV